MIFLHPEALWGLLALTIPVFIHLFNFQKTERIFFANTRLLTEVVQKTRKARQVKNWLLLLLRMLALSALVFAFAQPRFNSKSSKELPSGLPQVAVYLDNSASMSISKDEAKPFDQAWNVAKNIPTWYEKKGWFQLLTNQFESRHMWTSANGFLDQVSQVGNSFKSRNLTTVLERSNRQLNNQKLGENKIQVLLSDFQKSNTGNPTNLILDSSIKFQFLVFEHEKLSNVFVDSVWLAEPIQVQEKVQMLKVRLAQSGVIFGKPLNIRLMANGNIISGKTINLKDQPFFDLDLPFRIKSGEKLNCEIQIDDEPVTFDNRFYLTLQAPPPLPIFILDDTKNPFISAVLSNPLFTSKTGSLRSVDFEKLKQADFILLNETGPMDESLSQALENRCREGAAVVFIPSSNEKENKALPKWTGLNVEPIIATPGGKSSDWKIRLPLKNEPFFQGSFSEINSNSTQAYAKPTLQLLNGVSLLRFENGDPFLAQQKVGFGSVYVVASPIRDENSNLQKHPLFLPMIFKMAFSGSKSLDLPLYFRTSTQSATLAGDSVTISSETGITLSLDQISIRVNPRKSGNKIDFELPGETMKPGIWDTKILEKKAGSIAINSDKNESAMDFYSADDLRAAFADKPWVSVSALASGASTDHLATGSNEDFPLWKLCLIICLLFFVGEMTLTKLGKNPS